MADVWNETTLKEKKLMLYAVSSTSEYIFEDIKIKNHEKALVECYLNSEKYIPLINMLYSRDFFKNTALPTAIQLSILLEKIGINKLEEVVKQQEKLAPSQGKP